MSQPLLSTYAVSIVVRTKDRPILLKRALNSLAKSTYKNIQVVIINDGGVPVLESDVSNILGDISYKLFNLSKNLGRASSLNMGISESEKEYVCFLDDDDVLLPEGIGILIEAAKSNPASVIYGNVICKQYSPDGAKITTHWIMDSEYDKERLLLENFIPLNSLCIPKCLLSQIGDIDVFFPIYEDWDMLIRLSEIANFVHVDLEVAEYSIYVESTLTGKGGEEFQKQYRERILKKHFNKFTPAIILKFLFNAPHIKAKDNLIEYYIEKTQKHEEEIHSLRKQNDVLLEKLNFQSALYEENQTLKNSLNMQSKTINQLKEKLEKLNNDLTINRTEINRIYNSRSWRITKPLRVFWALFKKNTEVSETYHSKDISLDLATNRTNALPKVEVVIVNYNGKKYIQDCLDFLLKTEYPNFSITIVDNNSNDGSLELIEKKYPTVKLIKNKDNVGFGAANNQAIQETDTEYIALLNNDTVVTSNWLRPLVGALLTYDDIAAVSSKLLFIDNPKVINNAGGGMSFTGFGYDIGLYQPDNDKHSEPIECLFPSGAACLIRKDIYLKVGGFDKSFFMYHEDVDLGWRFWLYGYRVLYIPQSVVYHAFGGTSKKVGGHSFKADYGLQHAIRSLLKNYELKNMIKSFSLISLIGIKNVVYLGNTSYLKALVWNIKNIKDTFKHRKIIKRNRKIHDSFLIKKGLIFDGLYPPVFHPDYDIKDIDSYKKSHNRRNSILLGVNDHGNLGYGWHLTETSYKGERIKFRLTMSEAAIFLHSTNSYKLIIEAALPDKQVIKEDNKIMILINDTPFEVNIKDDKFNKYTLPINNINGFIEIKIRVSQSFIPHERYFNKDYRQIGIAVKKIEIINAETERHNYSGITVIIPTYNRSKELMRTLEGLSTQSISKDLFEVIVVDDGSTDNTASIVKEFIDRSIINLSYHFQQNKKQGSARNLGIGFAKHPIILFIGDDTTPEKDCLKEHLQTHNEKNIDGKTAVLGYTGWPVEFRTSPFAEYINGYGHQFGYALIKDGDLLDFTLFYTSNISISKDFLCKQNPIFDEDFKTYGWEDIELGYRLQQDGMTIVYNPKAQTRHYHKMDIAYFTRRQMMVGKGAHIILSKHPELHNLLKIDKISYISKYKTIVTFLKYLIYLCDLAHIPLPHRIYGLVLDVYYALGYKNTQ